MDATILGSRCFALRDQLRFADLTGDRNPMHVDAVFARRTQAGAPVVHGMHLLLWALDTFALYRGPDLPSVRSIKARFTSFVLVGDRAELDLQEYTARRAKLVITVNAIVASQISIDFGDALNLPAESYGALPSFPVPDRPDDMPFEDMQSYAGCMPFSRSATELAAHFAAASSWIGSCRTAAIGASSTVVGMVCPGLHSIYGSLSLDLMGEGHARDGLEIRVASSDARFRMLRISIAGSGVAGIIECMARIPPVPQETMHSLANRVSPMEFLGSTALVVGGSRGLGEVVAKLIAAGGGQVVITYCAGRTDAEKVVNEINAAGGDCRCLEYDVRQPAGRQLTCLAGTPTHLYYFATPVIFRQQAESYSPQRLREFLEFYVDGFWDLLKFLHSRKPDLSVFYPSTAFVAEPQRGMTEYAMAKGAGEILCARINKTLAPLRIHVSRLPRLATDQTASNLPVETQPTLDTLLPLVREVQGRAL